MLSSSGIDKDLAGEGRDSLERGHFPSLEWPGIDGTGIDVGLLVLSMPWDWIFVQIPAQVVQATLSLTQRNSA